MTTTTPAARAVIGRRGRSLDWRGVALHVALLLALVVSLATLVTLLVEMVRSAVPVIEGRGADFVTSNLSSRPEAAGVWQGIVGTLLIGAIVMVLSFPIGVATAIYLEEYAPDTRLTRFINVNIRNLAGVPSVVYGILGLAIFVKAFDGFTGGRSVVSAGVTMAILVLPIVIITTAEALRAVPDSLRQGGFGMGATRWDVVRRLVLPSAAPGILTGTVLSLSRALGETAPLILVGAVSGFFATSSDAGFVDRLTGDFTALPMIVFDWARQPRAEFRELTAAAIVVLLVVTLVANAAAILLRDRYARAS